MSDAAALLYQQYKDHYGYGPKDPNHLLAFARRKKATGLLNFYEARAIIQANDVSCPEPNHSTSPSQQSSESTKPKLPNVQKSKSAEIAPVQSESEPPSVSNALSICTSPFMNATPPAPDQCPDSEVSITPPSGIATICTPNVDQKENISNTANYSHTRPVPPPPLHPVHMPQTVLSNGNTDDTLQRAVSMKTVQVHSATNSKSKPMAPDKVNKADNTNKTNKSMDSQDSHSSQTINKPMTISNKPMPPKSPSKSQCSKSSKSPRLSPQTPASDPHFTRNRSGGCAESPMSCSPIAVGDDEFVPDPMMIPNAHRSLHNLPRPPRRTPSTRKGDDINMEEMVFPAMGAMRLNVEESPPPPTSWEILKDSGSIAPELMAELRLDDDEDDDDRLSSVDENGLEHNLENGVEDDEKSSNHQ